MDDAAPTAMRDAFHLKLGSAAFFFAPSIAAAAAAAVVVVFIIVAAAEGRTEPILGPLPCLPRGRHPSVRRVVE